MGLWPVSFVSLVQLVPLVGSEMAPIKKFEGLECGTALRELTNKTNQTN
jgi:hypothetical protein